MVAALTVCALWLVITGAFIALNAALPVALPAAVAKVGPFLIAGVLAGRLVDASGHLRKIVAAAVLVVVSAAGWTLFSFATTPLSGDGALILFAASLPVMLFAGAWAYLGMLLGGRWRERPTVEPEEADLERELRDELERQRSKSKR